VTNAVIKPSWKCSRDGVFLARNIVRPRPRIPVRIMNANDQNQVLSEGTTIGHGESAVWAPTIDDQKPETRRKQGLCKQLREVTVGARQNVSFRETQALGELLPIIKKSLQQREVTTGAQRKGTTGSIQATTFPFATQIADTL